MTWNSIVEPEKHIMRYFTCYQLCKRNDSHAYPAVHTENR